MALGHLHADGALSSIMVNINKNLKPLCVIQVASYIGKAVSSMNNISARLVHLAKLQRAH